jgi:hypothetical protein
MCPISQPASPQPGVRRRDVATAAGGSVAILSKVINHPHLVAGGIRDHVQDIVQDLGFQPDPRAQALPGLGTNASEPLHHSQACHVLQGHAGDPNPVEDTAAPPYYDPGFGTESVQPGDHLHIQVGPEKLSGTVDAVMPDGSCFWIWADGGMGRRLIDVSEATVLIITTKAD